MLGIALDAPRLALTRFALPKLAELLNAAEVLVHPGRAPYARHWVADTARRVDRDRVGVLLALAEEATWYVPDFLAPVPAGYETSIEDELHAVATAPAGRVRRELALAFRPDPPEQPDPFAQLGGVIGDPRRALPAPVAAIVERQGVDELCRCLAGQLEWFWHAALAPLWPSVRAVNDADVREHAFEAAGRGLGSVVELLDPRLTWDGARVVLRRPYDLTFDPPGGVVLAPSAFLPHPAVWHGWSGTAMLGYPALRRGRVWTGPDAPAPATRLFGDGWARLLSDLGVARTTSELAARQRLAPSTVSYHLARLHRTGLVRRRRQGRRVLYERTDRATETMRALGLTDD
ncbi:ArsR family transcriptional regulator [Jiangella alba]|uniref:Helix-turn-helix domain-containing protein n=1 Tax=Jiangella alba TaxID=561176 RepID=A0A1H5MA00_9ACTN|nr:ArsR family transcriptional regulator [Jiangella alba]SEE86186.1 Helix-turn-helix domain-containing protein [Jiangella alba]